MDSLSRRHFLQAAGAAAALVCTQDAVAQGSTKPAASQTGGVPRAYTFLNPQEARFIEAAVARLIPSDENGPGALEADVPNYIDKQLGGAWGAGERLYRSGPWHEGTPPQGYQLPFTPAELFRNGMRGLFEDVQASRQTGFDQLPPDEQDRYLTELQLGGKDFNGVPSGVFFESLLAMTIEGFFSDPVYGGNKDMVSWRMIGFPGAYANFYHLVDQHGVKFDREPISLASNGQGQVHVDPNIPAEIRPHDGHGHGG